MEFENKNGFKILGLISKTPAYRFSIEFEDGTILEANMSHISNGTVENKNSPTTYGIGYIGYGKHRAHIDGTKRCTSLHNRWRGIIRRCYDKNFKRYKDYGGKGIYVEKRWHSFQNFCEDILLKPNFKYAMDNNFELDKDFICNKIKATPYYYGKETTLFLPQKFNCQESQGFKLGLFKDGSIVKSFNSLESAGRHIGCRGATVKNIVNKKSRKYKDIDLRYL